VLDQRLFMDDHCSQCKVNGLQRPRPARQIMNRDISKTPGADWNRSQTLYG
jgi:hypothetical protein